MSVCVPQIMGIQTLSFLTSLRRCQLRVAPDGLLVLIRNLRHQLLCLQTSEA